MKNMNDLQTVCIWLIKKLCLDTEAETASIEQDITFKGEKIGRYKITITKL